MKKLITGIFAVLIAASGFAQGDLISNVFEKYAGKEGFTTVNITGDMLKLMKEVEMDRRDTVIQSVISEIRILATEKCKPSSGINLKDEVYSKLDKSLYKEMIHVKQTDEDVVIMLKEAKGRVQEMLILVGGSEDNAIVQIKGDMLLSELAGLASNYKVTGSFPFSKFSK